MSGSTTEPTVGREGQGLPRNRPWAQLKIFSAQELSERQLFFLVLASALVFIALTSRLVGWSYCVQHYGDNGAYAEVASAILHWNFSNIDIQHFMGYPYLIAVVSLILRLPVFFALSLVACVSSFVSVFVVARLVGTWAAAYFAILNFAWLQLSFLGGSEPLSMALGLGALLMFRKQRIFVSAALGSLAVTVRPLMIFVLIGIGLTLLWRKEIRAFLIALATGLAIGTLYVLPLKIYFGDPLLTVHSYAGRDYGAANIPGPHGQLFGWPFHGIVMGTILYPAPWTNMALSFCWIFLVVAGTAAMFSARFREYVRNYPSDGVFCALYLVSLFCYDYFLWARSNFMRFSIPVLPFVFFALLRWLPRSRKMVWILGIVSSALAACSAVGIRNVMK